MKNLTLRFIASNLFIASIIFISPVGVSAQQKVEPDLKSSQLRISFLPLGVSWEKKITNKQSLNLSAGYSYGLTFGVVEYDVPIEAFSLVPYLSGELRSYYARRRVKRELDRNSGNYLALAFGYHGRRHESDGDHFVLEDTPGNSYYVGPVWGMQRCYKSGFFLNLSLGLGYENGENMDGQLGFIGNGGIGVFIK